MSNKACLSDGLVMYNYYSLYESPNNIFLDLNTIIEDLHKHYIRVLDMFMGTEIHVYYIDLVLLNLWGYDLIAGVKFKSNSEIILQPVKRVLSDSSLKYLMFSDTAKLYAQSLVIDNIENFSSGKVAEGVELLNKSLDDLVLSFDILYLPDSLLFINDNCFTNFSINSIKFNKNLRKIGNGAFKYVSNI